MDGNNAVFCKNCTEKEKVRIRIHNNETFHNLVYQHNSKQILTIS